MQGLWRAIRQAARRIILWGHCHVPAGLRWVVGLPLVCGGLLGFLPILGFWMLPAGLALIALDIPPLRQRVIAWCKRDDGASPAQ